jgi:hypothetical protein
VGIEQRELAGPPPSLRWPSDPGASFWRANEPVAVLPRQRGAAGAL